MGDADLVVLCLVALSRHCHETGSPLTLSWHPDADGWAVEVGDHTSHGELLADALHAAMARLAARAVRGGA